jgi:hypothetical protein
MLAETCFYEAVGSLQLHRNMFLPTWQGDFQQLHRNMFLPTWQGDFQQLHRNMFLPTWQGDFQQLHRIKVQMLN